MLLYNEFFILLPRGMLMSGGEHKQRKNKGQQTGQKKKKGAPGSVGKSAGKIADYYMSGRLLEKKLRHVIQSSGYKAGIDWAEKYDAVDILRRLRHPERGLPPQWLLQAE